MANNLPPPPTYTDPVLVDPVTHKPTFNPIWLNWFLTLGQILSAVSSGSTISHENLLNLLGGAANKHYHFTDVEHTTLTAGPSQPVGVITPSGSPFTWQNTTGFNAIVVAQGGTVSDYSLSRDNTTFYTVGTAITAIPVVRGDYLRATYTGAPTLHYFPM